MLRTNHRFALAIMGESFPPSKPLWPMISRSLLTTLQQHFLACVHKRYTCTFALYRCVHNQFLENAGHRSPTSLLCRVSHKERHSSVTMYLLGAALQSLAFAVESASCKSFNSVNSCRSPIYQLSGISQQLASSLLDM